MALDRAPLFSGCADGAFLSSWVAISFQRRALLRAVVCKFISPAFYDAVSTDDVILSFEVTCKSKGKVHPRTGHEDAEEEEEE
jgi:hypothetical protein